MWTSPFRVWRWRTLQGLRTALALGLIFIPAALVLADGPTAERHPADPKGSVEIVDLSGSIELVGWNRPEIEVSGGSGAPQERVEVTTSGSHTRIRVPSYSTGQPRDDAKLTIHVPEASEISAHLVSTSLEVKGLTGDVTLHTIGGSLSGSVSGNLRASTVNGSVRMSARSGGDVEVRTINGDIELEAGSGEVAVQTVSGNAHIKLAAPARGRFKSISGNLTVELALASDAEVDAESVSGTVRLDFAAVPAADFEVQSFTGTIESCFGPQPTEARYGPGSRFVWKNGDARARVRVDTKSGDVHLCAAGAHRAAAQPPPRECSPPLRPASLARSGSFAKFPPEA